MFNWDKMARECWPISLRVLSDESELSMIYTPWYLSYQSEQNVSDSSRKPLKVTEAVTLINEFSKRKDDNVNKISSTYKNARQPIQLIVPAHNIFDHSLIIFASKHRIAALVSSAVDFKVMTFIVEGPVDADVLPDLLYWQENPSLRWFSLAECAQERTANFTLT